MGSWLFLGETLWSFLHFRLSRFNQSCCAASFSAADYPSSLRSFAQRKQSCAPPAAAGRQPRPPSAGRMRAQRGLRGETGIILCLLASGRHSLCFTDQTSGLSPAHTRQTAFFNVQNLLCCFLTETNLTIIL